jgi:hypothetical protein
MKKYRPNFSLACVMLVVIVFVALYQRSKASLGRSDQMTGYTLIGVCLLMLLLSLRKKLTLLSLGRLAIWQQIHHFAGVFGLIVYFMHAGFVVDGVLEVSLAIAFMLLSFSGIGHWYFNRRIPALMNVAGPPVRLEDVAEHRTHIANQAYAVALSAATHSKTACLAEFYTRNLSKFFREGRTMMYYLRPTSRVKRFLNSQLEGLGRYLNDEGQAAQIKLAELVQARDNIDFQNAMMLRIRAWNFCHVVLTWGFVAIAIWHVYVVHQFMGS